MSDVTDDSLDRCRHGKTAADFCPICDSGAVDLRRRDSVDLTEASSPETARSD